MAKIKHHSNVYAPERKRELIGHRLDYCRRVLFQLGLLTASENDRIVERLTKPLNIVIQGNARLAAERPDDGQVMPEESD